jgi:hypothetical protein
MFQRRETKEPRDSKSILPGSQAPAYADPSKKGPLPATPTPITVEPSTSSSYLEPSKSNHPSPTPSNYLQPSKPAAPNKYLEPSISSNNSYLQPTNIPDTYLGSINKTNSDLPYVDASKSSYINDPEVTNNNNMRYLNENYSASDNINNNNNNDNSYLSPVSNKSIEDTYLMPRHDSSMSARSNAPLLQKSDKNQKKTYAPSPPVPTKLSRFNVAPNTKETNV